MRLVLILLIFVSCASSGKRYKEEKVFYELQLNIYSDSLSILKIEYEKSESYIATEDVHQVMRTPEEKERQLKNLNAYRVELENRIQSIEGLINSYEDSLLLSEAKR